MINISFESHVFFQGVCFEKEKARQIVLEKVKLININDFI